MKQTFLVSGANSASISSNAALGLESKPLVNYGLNEDHVSIIGQFITRVDIGENDLYYFFADCWRKGRRRFGHGYVIQILK